MQKYRRSQEYNGEFWSKYDDSAIRMKPKFADTILSEMLGRTIGAIRTRRWKLKYKKVI
jgi:hypothetical protein